MIDRRLAGERICPDPGYEGASLNCFGLAFLPLFFPGGFGSRSKRYNHVQRQAICNQECPQRGFRSADLV